MPCTLRKKLLVLFGFRRDAGFPTDSIQKKENLLGFSFFYIGIYKNLRDQAADPERAVVFS